MHNKVSIEATIAIVIPIIQTLVLVIAEKFGNIKILFNSSNEFGTGKLTKCSFLIEKLLPEIMKNSFNKILTITATNAGGTSLIFFKNSTLVQAINIKSYSKVIVMEPN